MRDRESWHRPVSRELAQVWSGLPAGLEGVKPVHVCQVELALRLLQRLAPQEPAEGAYTLLGGYPFARAAGLASTDEHDRMLTAARHLLWTLRRGRAWRQSLESYRLVPERLRAYDVPEPREQSAPRLLLPTVAAGRIAVYDRALGRIPDFVRRPLPLAPAGRSSFRELRRAASVTIPASLVLERPAGHDLSADRAGRSAALTVTRAELTETARWMDVTERGVGVERLGHWEARLAELRIAPRDADGRGFTDGAALRIDGLLHLVGMVGAGKSTLMTLVAVWAARRDIPLRTTIVVGDAAEQLRLCELFTTLGLAAVPLLGASTRETHVQRLHRRLASRGLDNLLDHDAQGFDELSTVCVVDALRGTEATAPLRYGDAPCTSLYPERNTTGHDESPGTDPLPDVWRPGTPHTREPDRPDDEFKGSRHGCPIWAECPRHRTARAQVDALIWVANPASLVQSAVPSHLNDERLRQLELACIRSDIVFVDEADSVQMKLDELFAPSATLIQPGIESWLDRLHTHKIEELSRQGRLPLTDRQVEQWNAALAVVTVAADRLYRLLISDESLRDWVDTEYFSPWALQEKLLIDWFDEVPGPDAFRTGDEPDAMADEQELYEDYDDANGEAPEPGPIAHRDPRRDELAALLDAFRDDPLGGHGRRGTLTDLMVETTQDLLHGLSPNRTQNRVRSLLEAILRRTPVTPDDPARGSSEKWLDLTCRHLEFTLLLSALHQRLDRLTHLWPHVEAALRLDTQGKELARRAPLDYAPLIPEAPMGNVLGFQYLPDDKERDEAGRTSGTLRFFRCAGVGRELLLSLTELGVDREAGRAGPHVVLMSGTSWAGESTRAHVLAPVGAVLKPSAQSLEAVARTSFSTHFLYDEQGRPMKLSGTDPRARITQARAFAAKLGRPGPGGCDSPLDLELARVADDHRKRALLLVGSYREAYAVADTLDAEDRWRGRVRVLVPDDADLDLALHGTDFAEGAAFSVLRRGDLALFADDPAAEVLVAPLLAVERGHNILNAQRNAAFGTALFLARPHPRPDELSLSIFAVNDWISRFVRDQPRDDDRPGPATFTELVTKASSLDRAGRDLRYAGRQEWRRLLSRRYIYSRLAPWEKRAFAWDQLVTMWQVIGRLVRGGVPARVVFVDAAFAPRLARALAPTAEAVPVPPADGLLRALQEVLAPYFAADADPADFPDPADPALARLLYQPFHDALLTLGPRRVTR
ncbi:MULTISPECIES: hypothetical protein [Streptomyces rochei group]|uniref:pPIWI-RE three-gene island domain-containing protein n=1 Tax=Streptomyces plicatus TaxID=1922 RepID=A0ABW1Y3T6_STRPL|nr:hypothetical protein [Streptomyces plicatus]GGZ46522.1 hypothetical protein GCM10010301_18680 [Streptomyces plicatus]